MSNGTSYATVENTTAANQTPFSHTFPSDNYFEDSNGAVSGDNYIFNPNSYLDEESFQFLAQKQQLLEQQHIEQQLEQQQQQQEIEQQQQMIIPSYMEPTIASTLPPYMAGEHERVRNSYRTGTCWTIKDIPAELKVGVITAARRKKVTDNLLQGHEQVFKPASSRKLHLFNRHQYVGSDYDKEKVLKKTNADEKKTELDNLARKPFVVTSRIRSKTEDIFYDPDWKFPSMGPGGGKVKLEEMTRGGDSVYSEKFVNEPGMVNNIHVGQGVKVQEWCKLIHAKLSKDWSGYRFRIKFTKSNELLVQFLKPLDSTGQYPVLAKRSTSAPELTATAANASAVQSPTTREVEQEPRTTGSDSGKTRTSNNNNSNATTTSAATTNVTTTAPAASQLNVIFPPPNNMLNKYMHHQAVHGTISKCGFKRRGDRWNMYEVEYAYLADEPSSTATTTAATTNAVTGAATATNGAATGAATDAVYDEGHSANDRLLSSKVPFSSRSISATANVAFSDLQPQQQQLQQTSKRSLQAPKSVSFSAAVADTAADRISGGHSNDDTADDFTSSVTAVATAARGDKVTIVDSSSKGTDRAEPAMSQLHYLTFSFYAPWVHTAHLNTQRAASFHQRRIAREFGDFYRSSLRPSLLPLSSAAAGTADDDSSSSGSYSKPPRRFSIQESSNKIAAMSAFITGITSHHQTT